eukprot:COSAG01_NODE_1340_length_10648_cov_10.144089_8_plen_176_part_00
MYHTGLISHTGFCRSDNYNVISLTRLLVLIDLMPGGVSDLKRNAKALFEQYRDCVAPSGFFPNWGASFNDDASGVDEGAHGWPYIFERAAVHFQEPSFRWVARQLWQSFRPPTLRNGTVIPRPDQWQVSTALLEQSGALANIAVPGFVDIPGPMVVLRNNLLGEPVPNKLVVPPP